MECISRSIFVAIGLIHYLYHFVIFNIMKEEWKLLILWILAVTFILIFSDCTSAPNKGIETHYPLLDTSFKLHKYRENIQWVLFPKNKKRTEYCSVHFGWEDIQPIYRQIGDDYKWQYKVTKNKKSWK